MGLLAFPFIGQGKVLGYTKERQKERKRRKRKTGEKKALDYFTLVLRWAGPAGGVDDNEDGSLS
jgi:hypothetical protein